MLGDVRSRTPRYVLRVAGGVILIALGVGARSLQHHVSTQGAWIWLHDTVGTLEVWLVGAGAVLIFLTIRRWRNHSRTSAGEQ